MNIYVGNLSFDETDETLETAFANHGEVQSARVITDRYSGRSRGFGFVEMPNQGRGRGCHRSPEWDRAQWPNVDGQRVQATRGRSRRWRAVAVVAAVAVVVVVVVVVVVDTAGVPAGRLDRNDSDYRVPARKKRTEGRAIVRSRGRQPTGPELRVDHDLLLRLQTDSE